MFKLEIKCYDYEKDKLIVKKSICCNVYVVMKVKVLLFRFFKGDFDKLDFFYEIKLDFICGDIGCMFSDYFYDWDNIFEYY